MNHVNSYFETRVEDVVAHTPKHLTFTTDFFIMLPGVIMDKRNLELFNSTLSSVLDLYSEEYVHVVFNSGDPSHRELGITNREERKYKVVQNNNFALGAFAAAAHWMDRFRPYGSFAILQHSNKLIAKAKPPACDIELINVRQRCGDACVDESLKLKMLTAVGTDQCFPLLNDVMSLYNATCAFPCCSRSKGTFKSQSWHFDEWPLMAHNAVLLTPRARSFLRPLKEFVDAMPSNTIGKFEDQATERLFGLFSSMLLETHGSIWKRAAIVENYSFSDPLEAYHKKFFTCSQDLTMKIHGGLS